MTLMWVTFFAMTLVGVLIVVAPLLRFRPATEPPGKLINAAVFRDRVEELDDDLAQGRIAPADYQQLKQELELTLLQDVDAVGEDTRVRRGGRWLVLPLLVLVPIAAFIIYGAEGYRQEIGDWFATQARMEQVLPELLAGDFSAAEQADIRVDDFIRTLQRQLQKNPDDARGWYLLGVSYLQVQMPQQSELAFRRALNLEPGNLDFLMGQVQATLTANGGRMSPEIRQVLQRVIAAQPNNPRPYMTMGMALFQTGDFQAAINIWEQYLAQDNADPRAVELLNRSIAVAREQSAQQQAASAATGSVPELVVTVELAENIKNRITPTDTLFVFAKAAAGPPMPLAVVRQPVADWPVTVVLNDQQAMTPAMTLSKFDRVQVQARVSAAGTATAQSGDWQAKAALVDLRPGRQPVQLRIDHQVP